MGFLNFRAKGVYHQRAEVEGKVQSLVLPSIVKEDDVCDDSGLCCLSRSGSDAIEPTLSSTIMPRFPCSEHLHASSHETAVCVCLRSPDTASKADDCR